VNFEGKQNMHR